MWCGIGARTFAVLAMSVVFVGAARAETEPNVIEDPAELPLAGFDKGFFIQSPDGAYRLKFGTLLMTRYTFESLDRQGDNEETSAFSIPRARLTLSGNLFGKTLSFKFQTDFSKGQVALKDYLIDYAVVPNWLHVRAGQWKRPFSRQLITSSSALQLVDRSITDDAFQAGRDIGVSLGNNYEKSPGFEWALGVFNGTGEKGLLSGDVVVDPASGEGEITGGKFNNVPRMFNPTLVARVGFNQGGIKGYSEPDLEGGPFRIGIGGSALVELDADGDEQSSVRGEIDYIMKAHGFSHTAAFYLSSQQDGADFGDRSFEALGFHAQAGYVIAGLVEPIVRYAMIAPDGDENDTQVITGGVAVYMVGHSFKWVTDVAGVLKQKDDTTDVRVRTQLQLAF